MRLLEILFPPVTTVQKVSQYFIELDMTGRWVYYTSIAVLFYCLMLLSVYASARSVERPLKPGIFEKILLSDITFCVLIIAFVLMARVPLAITGLQNPDEPIWVIEAKTLLHDPRIFVSVDPSTGGPLVPFSLLALKVFNLPIDQGTLKIMSGSMMALALSFLFMAGTKIMSTSIARLSVLPLVALVALMRDNDMIAYNSEHPVILLLCVALFFLARVCVSGPGKYNLNLIFLGIFLGLVPFAKLQGAPMAFFIGLVGCYIAYRNEPLKNVWILIGSAVGPTVVFLIALWSYGGLEYYWTAHILQNLMYANQISIPVAGSVIIYKILVLTQILFIPKESPFFVYYSLNVIIFGFVVLLSIPGKTSLNDRLAIVFSVAMLLISFYCITVPVRPFAHYGLFALVPFTITTGILISSVARKARMLTLQTPSLLHPVVTSFLSALMILISSFYFFFSYFTYQPNYLGFANERHTGYAPQGPIGAVLDHYYSPGAKMAIWGDKGLLFEGNDFLLGTRFGAASFNLITDSIRGYFLKTYVDDMKSNEPELFVYHVESDNFRTYPVVSEYVLSNYTLDNEVEGYQIFVRNTKLSGIKSWKAERSTQKISGETFHGDMQLLKKSGSMLHFSGWTVFQENVKDQRVYLALVSKTDTTFVDTFKTTNQGVVDFAHNSAYLWCGFEGFVPLKDVQPGDLNVGILVRNKSNGAVGFKMFSMIANKDTVLP